MFQNQNDKLVDRFEDWWRRDNKGLPLMWVVARRDCILPTSCQTVIQNMV